MVETGEDDPEGGTVVDTSTPEIWGQGGDGGAREIRCTHLEILGV